MTAIVAAHRQGDKTGHYEARDLISGSLMANYYRWLALCYGVTLSAHPALALPSGRDETGMPFGLQLIGRLRGGAELLTHAHALEQLLAANVAMSRPQPDPAALSWPRPELKSTVTHPPVFEGLAVKGALAAPV
ncbi:amidase family protein [Calidifontimicrobium sp. SYSU G02091]|uniref:amidase family protein n=1 Tax=Calidifontimicrobium sp. SYSU G02091 TaxID=2926421 RepID=UPI001F531555|nr:amidase family protein [Calidifontimicrobium sp. SYSU G02091]MCI1191269.1 amidase family protein [Calidifontimicrobium sp. SYSU G02091]